MILGNKDNINISIIIFLKLSTLHCIVNITTTDTHKLLMMVRTMMKLPHQEKMKPAVAPQPPKLLYPYHVMGCPWLWFVGLEDIANDWCCCCYMITMGSTCWTTRFYPPPLPPPFLGSIPSIMASSSSQHEWAKCQHNFSVTVRELPTLLVPLTSAKLAILVSKPFCQQYSAGSYPYLYVQRLTEILYPHRLGHDYRG